MTRLAVTWRDTRRSDQLLVAAHPQTRLRDLFGSAGRLFVNGQPVLAEATLAAAGVRDGAIIGTAPSGPPVPVAPPGRLALLVASGASAGASCEVPANGAVGRLAPLALGDDEISGRHLQIRAVRQPGDRGRRRVYQRDRDRGRAAVRAPGGAGGGAG